MHKPTNTVRRCVLGELWLEEPLFTFSELLRYKTGKFDPLPKLSGIENVKIRELVEVMISKDRDQRPNLNTLDLYVSAAPMCHVKFPFFTESFGLTLFRTTIFPSYFEFLHKYIGSFMGRDPDEIVRVINSDLDLLRRQFLSDQTKSTTTTTITPTTTTATTTIATEPTASLSTTTSPTSTPHTLSPSSSLTSSLAEVLTSSGETGEVKKVTTKHSQLEVRCIFLYT